MGSMVELSNLATSTSLLVYTLAFTAYCICLALGSRRVVASPVAVSVGAGASSDPATEVASASEPGLGQRRAARIAWFLYLLATALLVTAFVTRGLAAGRVPWANMFEFALTGSVLLAVLFTVVQLAPQLLGLVKGANYSWLGCFVSGVLLVTLWIALKYWYTDASQLVPALQSRVWLIVHVFTAALSSALFILGFLMNVLQLVQSRSERSGKPSGFMQNFPSSSNLEMTAHRFYVVAFPLWTLVLITGAIWAQEAWGRYWNWDPKEIWTFATFVMYAAYLHARATAGWSKRAAWFAMLGFACLLINFGIVNVFADGLHSYAGIG